MKFFIGKVFIPLFIGVLIYFIFKGIPILNLNKLLNCPDNQVMRWVINSLPDGLWLFALLSYIKLIWYNDSQMLRNGWILVVLLGTLLTEFAQYFGVISGTFDVSDILTYVSAFLLYLTIDHKNRFNLKTI